MQQLLRRGRAVCALLVLLLIPVGPAYAQDPAEAGPSARIGTSRGTNVAASPHGATVTATSEREGSTSYLATSAIDGNLSSSWWAAPGSIAGEELRITTGDPDAVVDRLVIRGSTSTTSMKDFELWVAESPEEGAELRLVATGTVPRTTASHEFPITPARVGQAEIRVVSNWGHTTYLTVAEVELHTRARAGGVVNRLEGPAAAVLDASSQHVSYPASNILNAAGLWRTTAPVDQRVTFELGGGRPYLVDALRLHGTVLAALPRDIELQLSATDAEDASFATATAVTTEGSTAAQTFSFPETTARYARLRIAGVHGTATYAQLNRVEVLAPDGFNVADGTAVGGGVVQVSSGDATATRAIDSNDGTYWQAATAGEEHLTARVHDGGVHVVDGVRLLAYNATTSPNRFEIRAGEELDDLQTVHSGALAPDGLEHIIAFPPVAARYVQLAVLDTHGAVARVRTFHALSPMIGGWEVPFSDLSTGGDDEIVGWHWDFGDGATSSERHPLHRYLQAGTYPVTLTVLDAQGRSSASQVAYTAASAPTAALELPANPREGVAATFLDRSEDRAWGLLSWDWTIAGTATSAANVSRTFTDDGTYPVALRVTNTQGISAVVSDEVVVANQPPVANAGANASVEAREPWTPTSSSTDPGSADRASLVCRWDYGDGAEHLVDPCGTTGARVPHTYAEPGTYTARLTVTDKDGGEHSSTTTVTVRRRQTSIAEVRMTRMEGGGLEVRARLVGAASWRPLADEVLTFAHGQELLTAVTDAEGVATATLATATASDAEVRISFAGDSANHPAELLRSATMPRGDIVFGIDLSGSMGGAINGVKQRVSEMAGQLGGQLDFQLGLVTFGGTTAIRRTLTSDVQAFRAAVNPLSANGGGFEPGFQATTVGMSDAMGFRENAGACMILVTDEDADIGPQAPQTREDALAALRARNAVFFGIVNPTFGTTPTDYGPEPGSLAAETEGSVFNISSFVSNPGPVLEAILDQCASRIARPDLTVTKTDGATEAAPGDRLTYTLEVGNVSPGLATGVVLTDELPSELSFVEASDGGTAVDGVVTWPEIVLAPGETVSRTLVVEVRRATPNESVIINTASVRDDGEHGEDLRPEDNTATDTTTVVVSNHEPVADAGGPYEVEEGDLVLLGASASTDPDDDPLTITWDLDGDGTFESTGSTVVYRGLDGPDDVSADVRVCDPDGLCAQDTAHITVHNVAPTVAAGRDRATFTGERVPLRGGWTDPARDLDDPYAWTWDSDGQRFTGTGAHGDVAVAAPTYLQRGAFPATLGVVDADGGAGSDELVVTVLNRPPSCVDARPDTTVVWPANHSMAAISVDGVVDTDGDPVSVEIVSIHSDEPLNTLGDGSTEPDGDGIGTATAWVRAERSGTPRVPGDGRVYTIGYRATDDRGGACLGEVTVTVPHDMRGAPAVDSGVRYDAITGARVEGGDEDEPPVGEVPVSLAVSVDDVTAHTVEGTPVEIGLTARNLTGDALAFHLLGDEPAKGVLGEISAVTCTAWGDGTICTATVTYTPDPHRNGADSFRVVATDGEVGWAGTVAIGIAAVNDVPTARSVPAKLDLDEDTGPHALRITGEDVETPAAALTFTLVEAPRHGWVHHHGDPVGRGDRLVGSPLDLTYTPAPERSGDDAFTIRVTDDGEAGLPPASAEVTVPVTVHPVDDAPDASAVAVTTAEGAPVEVALAATDVDSAALTFTAGEPPVHGTLGELAEATCTADGAGSACTTTVTYTPGEHVNGTDAFVVAVSDGHTSTSLPVSVTITPVNSAPIGAVEPDHLQIDEDSGRHVVALSGSDVETPDDALVFEVTGLPARGTLRHGDDELAEGARLVGAPLELSYEPAADFHGTDELVVRLVDDGDGDDPAAATDLTLPITVHPVDDAPEAVDVDVTTAEDTPVEVTVTATDIDSTSLELSVGAQPEHGTLDALSTDCAPEGQGARCTATATYTPGADFYGSDGIVVTVRDATSSTSAAVTVFVTPVNDPPVAEADRATAERDTPETIDVDRLLANDRPGPDTEAHQQLAVTAVSGAVHGSVELDGATVVFTPSAGFLGEASFAYTVCDDGRTAGEDDPLCAEGTVTVEVVPPNAAPLAADVTATTDEDVAVELTLSARDEDGDPLELSVAQGPEHGALGDLSPVSCTPDGSATVCNAVVTYTPHADVAVIDGFTFSAHDGRASATARATVYVAPVNDAPSATADPAHAVLAEDTEATIVLDGGDVETPAAELVVEITAVPARGLLQHEGRTLEVGDRLTGVPAEVRYVPTPDANGDDGFTFDVVDGGQYPSPALSANGSAALTVTAVNDPPVPGSFRASAVQGRGKEIAAADVAAAGSPGPVDEAAQQLTVTAVAAEATTNGTVSLADGVITYTPDAAYLGEAAFGYTLCDDGTTDGAPDARCADGVVTVVVGDGGPDVSSPVIDLRDVTVTAGQTAVVPVSATDDRGVTALELTVDGAPFPIDGDGVARIPTTEPTALRLEATAGDAAGNTATRTAHVLVQGDDDGVSPTGTFGAEPAEGAELSVSTPIAGSATDEHLIRWELTATPLSPAGSAALVLGGGNEPVVDGLLGTLDPSALAGGEYRLRLTVWDAGGRMVRRDRVVTVVNEAKYGLFSMTFTDAVVPLASFPITVQRTYSSGGRLAKGDFGFGWSLGLQAVKLETDNAPGDGWTVENRGGGFLANYVAVPHKPHTVTIVDDNDDAIVFDFTPRVNNPQVDPRYLTAAWTERTSKGATLTPLAGVDLFLSGDQLADFDTADTYAPPGYRLTLKDGRRYTFRLDRGLTEYADVHGNVMTVTRDGITSSRGVGMAFTRDAAGRITAITTPAGLVTRYRYDAAGNLAAVTDPAGNETTFGYDGRHLLTGIVDPLGRVPTRQEYDEAGRLVALVDAAGNRIEVSSDATGRREAVTDRLGNVTVRTYDAAGRVLEEIHPDGATEEFTYDAEGRELTRTDGLGRTTTSTYDARGNRTSRADDLGNTTTYDYDARDNLVAMEDPLGNTTTYAYDAKDNLTLVTHPDASEQRFTYDAQGNVLTQTDEVGGVTTHTYDAKGNKTKTRWPDGTETTYTYDDDGRKVSETGRTGGTSGFDYDGVGNIVEHTDSLGGVTRNAYDPIGKRTEQVDPLGGAVTTTYDDLGRVTSVTDASGGVMRYGYDAEGRRTQVLDGDGTDIRTGYDARGRETSRSVGGVTVEQRTYDAAGQLRSVTDAAGRVTTFGYDDGGRLVRTELPDGTVETFTHDAAGRVISSTDPSGTTTLTYDVRGRLASRTTPQGTTSTYRYDGAGRLVSERGPDGAETTYGYDDAGRLDRVEDPLGNVTAYAHDGDGRMVSITDALGRTTSYAFDARGHLTRRTVAGHVVDRYTTDAMGRVLTRTALDGSVTAHTYDAAGRLTGTDHADGRTTRVTYTPAGRRATVTDQRGTTRYAHDGGGRLTSVEAPEGTVSYTYTPDGRLATRTDPGGTTSYEQDSAGRVSAVVDPSAGRFTVVRDHRGLPVRLTYPNGVVMATTYDAQGQATGRTVTAADGQVLAAFAITRDDAGRVRAVGEEGPAVHGPVARTYGYDAAGRLTSGDVDRAGTDVVSESYTLDGAGNRTRVTSGSAVTDATFDELDRITRMGDVTYTHDANGRRTRAEGPDGTTTYTYDSDDRLVGVVLPDGPAVTHGYDAEGNRTTTRRGTERVDYVLDVNRQLPVVVAETDGAGSVTATYTYVDDELVAATRAGVVSYVHADGSANVRLLTAADGSITDTFDYDAFGVLRDRTGTTDLPYGYGGQRYDADTGLYYLRARYYDPASTRFLTRDPFQGTPLRPLSFNAYAYADGDPVNRWDPTGRTTGVLSFGFSMGLNLSISMPSFAGVLATVKVGLWVSGAVAVGHAGSVGIQIAGDKIAERKLAIEAEKLAAAIAAASAAAACGQPLFHYTGREGALGILASQSLWVTPAFTAPDGRVHPPGAYATDLLPVPPNTRRGLQDMHKGGDRNWDVSWYVMLCRNQNPTFIPTWKPTEWYAPGPVGGSVSIRTWTIGPNLMLP